VQDGERFLQTQPFWADMAKAENLIRGKEMLKADENRSDLTSNRLKRIFREQVAALSDVRYPEAWMSDNKAYAGALAMFTKVAKGVWYESRAPLSFRRMTQWTILGGNGFLWPVYRRKKIIDPYSTALCFDDYGPRDVVPFMMPQDNNIQGCYACTIVRMMSVPDAHARFPEFQDKLRPVSRKRLQANAVSARMAFIDALRGENNALPWSEQLCEIRYTLVRDLSINQTDRSIPMGDPGASWSYVVPARGMDITSNDVRGGKRYMRPATFDDARMYPNMRLIITGSGAEVPLYDGPAWDWHGMFPPRFQADDWVTESYGFPLIRDVLDTERTRQFTERAVDMKIKAQMDPALIYDQTAINPATAEEFDPWEMRKRLGVDGDVDKALRTAVPESLLKVGSEPFEWLKYLAASEDDQLGVNQMAQLQKMKMSSGDSADDLLKLEGPIVRDISSSMESPMADVMEMVKYDILQYFDTARVMSYVGPDGVTPETFDLDPTSLVPSHMEGEDQQGASQFSRMERAKNFARSIRTQIVPGGIHGITQTQQKLMYQQAFRSGFAISPMRVAKSMGIENWGTLNGSTDLEQWQDFKRMELEFAAKLKEEGASLMPQGAQQPSGAGPGGGAKGSGGRPPSGRKPPAAKTKGSAEGPRLTTTTS
jgi:hypothetical protein